MALEKCSHCSKRLVLVHTYMFSQYYYYRSSNISCSYAKEYRLRASLLYYFYVGFSFTLYHQSHHTRTHHILDDCITSTPLWTTSPTSSPACHYFLKILRRQQPLYQHLTTNLPLPVLSYHHPHQSILTLFPTTNYHNNTQPYQHSTITQPHSTPIYRNTKPPSSPPHSRHPPEPIIPSGPVHSLRGAVSHRNLRN